MLFDILLLIKPIYALQLKILDFHLIRSGKNQNKKPCAWTKFLSSTIQSYKLYRNYTINHASFLVQNFDFYPFSSRTIQIFQNNVVLHTTSKSDLIFWWYFRKQTKFLFIRKSIILSMFEILNDSIITNGSCNPCKFKPLNFYSTYICIYSLISPYPIKNRLCA